MTSQFALNTLVWLKQPEYPWWPGVVLDPAALEMEIPAGYDTCVLCLPSLSSSVAFANSKNIEEVIRFNPNSDTELLETGKQHVDCAAAIEEALRVYEQQQQQQQQEESEKNEEIKKKHNNMEDAAVIKEEGGKHKKREKEEREEAKLTARRKHEESKAEKKEKKRQHKNREVEESLSFVKRHKKRRGGKKSRLESESDNSDDDDDDDDDDSSNDDLNLSDDNDTSRHSKRRTRRSGGESNNGVSGKSRRKVTFNSKDQYEYEAQLDPKHQEDDAEYIAPLLRANRRPASDITLNETRKSLESLAALATSPSGAISVSEILEERILDALSPLTAMDVTFTQLHKIRIGVTVGKFLSRAYPVRIVGLASAILSFWFRQLPIETQKRLQAQSTLDLASNDTTLGSEREDLQLGPVGVQIEDCFSDDEGIDEPALVAKRVEGELALINDEVISMALLDALRNRTSGSLLRRGLIDGTITPQELVANAVNPGKLLLRLQQRSGEENKSNNNNNNNNNNNKNRVDFDEDDSRRVDHSLVEPESPLVDNTTTLYACPNCGAREAIANEYSVQAHDNMAVFVRCVKCNETWNVEA